MLICDGRNKNTTPVVTKNLIRIVAQNMALSIFCQFCFHNLEQNMESAIETWPKLLKIWEQNGD